MGRTSMRPSVHKRSIANRHQLLALANMPPDPAKVLDPAPTT